MTSSIGMRICSRKVVYVSDCTRRNVCTPYINLSYLREKGIEDVRKIAEIHRMLNKGLKHRKVFKINANKKYP